MFFLRKCIVEAVDDVKTWLGRDNIGQLSVSPQGHDSIPPPLPPGPAIRSCRAGEGEEEAEAQGQEAGAGDENTQGTPVLAFTTFHHAL